MSDSLNTCFRRHPRYRIKNHAGTTVTIDTGSGASETLSAKLVDISLGGAKFETNAAITVAQKIAVRIDATEPARTIEVEGEVLWVRPADAEAWHVGCEFAQKLPADVLEDFARDGVLDRRLRQRTPLFLEAAAKWELESEGSDVSIVDYSAEGGFRLLVPSTGQPGRRVELQFNKDGRDVVVRGRSRWESSSEEGYQVGCEFLTGHDSLRFSEMLDGQSGRSVSGRGWLQALGRRRPLRLLALLARRRRVRRLVAYSSIVCLLVMLASILFSNPTWTVWLDAMFTADLKSGGVNTPALQTDAGPPDQEQTRPNVSSSSIEAPRHSVEAEIVPRIAEAFLPGYETPPTSAESNASEGVGDGPALTNSAQRAHVDPEVTVPLPPPQPPDASFAVDRQEDRPLSNPESQTAEFVLPRSDDTGMAEPLRIGDVEPTSPVSLGSVTDLPGNDGSSNLADEEDVARALNDFHDGCSFYRARQFQQAIVSLKSAVEADPSEPLYVYVLALAQFQHQQDEQARESVDRAAELEQERPLADWGRTMEGFQGPARVWLEQARRRSLSNRDAT